MSYHLITATGMLCYLFLCWITLHVDVNLCYANMYNHAYHIRMEARESELCNSAESKIGI
jgi:hypothetical protein